jgi:LemA protein
MQKKWFVLGGVVLFLLIVVGSCAHTYNKLIGMDQDVKSSWAEVENAYQSRADQVPNAIAIVKKASSFEQETLTKVVEARSQIAKVNLSADDLSDPAKLKAFEDAQANLGSSLSRLMVVAEQYPELKSIGAFTDLQAQLSGLDNRIRVARKSFNDSAQAFNTARDSFPTNMLAGFFGSKFNEKAYFSAKPGAENVPTVQF